MDTVRRFLCILLLSVGAAGYVQNVNGQEGPEKHWALLVAGSAGWFNYRHQADVCHAYHILKNHGFPDERIVVMMYDDIANSSQNPTPGIIINHPDGSDVYHGVPKDYASQDVTAENFLNILQGNEEKMKGIGSEKVIKSGPNDHVFVNFVDHGAFGIIGFPSDFLHSRQLNNAIKSMYKAKKFKQMVLYIEACESGSMFRNLLPKHINVYATTAANSNESSYACYYDPKRNTYLGDVYSVKWMEDSDKENLKKETLHKQFKIVRTETNTSHVQQFGDKSISKEVVEEFQGKKMAKPIELPEAPFDAVPSQDVPLAIATHTVSKTKGKAGYQEARQQLNNIIMIRKNIDKTMEKIVSAAVPNRAVQLRVVNNKEKLMTFDSYDCYEGAVAHFNRYCYNINRYEYSMHKLYILARLCQEAKTDIVLKSIYQTCLTT